MLTEINRQQTEFFDMLVNHWPRTQMYLRDYGHEFDPVVGTCDCGLHRDDFDAIAPHRLDLDADVCPVHGAPTIPLEYPFIPPQTATFP